MVTVRLADALLEGVMSQDMGDGSVSGHRWRSVCQDFGDGWGLLRPGPGALVGGVGRVVADAGDAFGRPVVLDQDLAVDVGEGDGGGVPDRGGSVPGQGAADQERDAADVDGARCG